MENQLPKGWYKEEVIRKSGLSAGKTDIYYYGPDGKKYRSKPQIARQLGGGDYDLTVFDFKSGSTMSQSSIVRRAKGKRTAYDFSKGFRGEENLSLPVRQTASIFKQPVTVVRSHPDSQTRHDVKHGPPDSVQPRQLFWERGLTGLRCSDIDEEALKCISLPTKIKGIGPDLTTENLLQSIAAALHLNNSSPVVGQSQSAAKFAKNPTVYINTTQPLIQQVVVTDDDIKQQETKVTESRRKLEELLAALEKSNREALVRGDRPLSAIPSESGSEISTASAAKHEGRVNKRKATPVQASQPTEAMVVEESDAPQSPKKSKPEEEAPEEGPKGGEATVTETTKTEETVSPAAAKEAETPVPSAVEETTPTPAEQDTEADPVKTSDELVNNEQCESAGNDDTCETMNTEQKETTPVKPDDENEGTTTDTPADNVTKDPAAAAEVEEMDTV